MSKIVSVSKLSRALKSLWNKSKELFATKSELNNGLSGKANNGHNHDDRYYTEGEVNNKLATKSNTDHGHTKLTIPDARNENKKPSEYPTGAVNEFKQVKAINNPNGSNTFSTYTVVQTLKGWSDSSGGNAIQVSYSSKSEVEPLIAVRTANCASEQWGAWNNIAIGDFYRVDLPTVNDSFDNYYKMRGKYNVSSSQSIVNAPYTGAIYGTLDVFDRNNNGGSVIQQFTDLYCRMYIRVRNSEGVWTSWTTVRTSASSGNIQAGVNITKEGDDFYINY